MKNLNERFSRRGTEAQSVPVKISASPRPCEKIKTKDSGIPWIGEIHADWEIRRIKYSGKFTKGKLPETFNSDGIGEAIIGASEMNGNVPKIFTQDSFLPHATVDDVLILWDGANAGLVSCGIPGILSSTVVKYSCDCSRYTPRYVYYLFKYFEDYFRSKVGGTTIPHMNPAFIDACALLLPPAGTQKRIAKFLDKKCAEIDALIALQEKMITELKSYKQSVITEAVTRGVPAKTKEIKISHGVTEARSVAGTPNASLPNQTSPKNYILEREQKTSPDAPCPRASVRENIGNSRGDVETQSVPVKISASQRPCEKIQTKDSGIPWLGSIPAHWEVLPLKRLCKMNAGENLTSLEIEKDGGFPVYGGNGFRGFYKKYNCSGEYILVGRQGALAGNIHKVCGCFWATDHALITRCTSLTNIPYLSYLLDAMNLNQYALQTAAQPGLSVGVIQSLYTTVPPRSEQNAIVVFLDQKCAEIDSLISLKQQKITTLQNYKKSVIFEYVTGKKEA